MDATTIMLASGILGVVLFTVVWLVEGMLRPDFSPSYHPISALSLGARGWIQATSFVVTGVLLVAFAVGVRTASGGVTVPVLLVVGD